MKKSIEKEYKKITKKYSNDYFDEHTQELIKCCILFIELLKEGNFEYDTAVGDALLLGIKNEVNQIDI